MVSSTIKIDDIAKKIQESSMEKIHHGNVKNNGEIVMLNWVTMWWIECEYIAKELACVGQIILNKS